LLPVDFPAQSLWLLPQQCRALRNLVAIVNPDIIHSHFVGTTLTARIALGKDSPIPRMFQVPGPLHLEHLLFQQLDLLTAGKADYWTGSCKWTRQNYLDAGIAEDRVFLSYYGTDTDTFTLRQKGTLRHELRIAPETNIVGMVAFMYAPKWFLGQKRGLKGHEDLIDALSLCCKKRKDIVGVFIGGAWNNKEWYEKQIRSYGKRRCGEHAFFLGTRTDVADLYPDIDVAVHPSHSENVGGAVESMLSGIPTIATEVGGFPDLVHHGETGWLVPPQCPEKLADTILEVLTNPHLSQKIAIAGQQLAREMFNVRTTSAQIADIYSSILQGEAVV
jgi:glycosyltransferase involved in cell wall biosynthesis